MDPLSSSCGLFCGACTHFIANLPEGRHLLSEDLLNRHTPEEFTCQGCHSDKLYIHPGCRECRIRDCCDAKEVTHCGQCGDFPCQLIEDFTNDGHPHHLELLHLVEQRNQMSEENWIREQQDRWTCSGCGVHFSWYEVHCQVCGMKLKSYANLDIGSK